MVGPYRLYCVYTQVIDVVHIDGIDESGGECDESVTLRFVVRISLE